MVGILARQTLSIKVGMTSVHAELVTISLIVHNAYALSHAFKISWDYASQSAVSFLLLDCMVESDEWISC